MRLRFWLLAYDLFAWLDWSTAALYAIGKAGDATDWGDGDDCSGGSGEGPF